MPKGDATQVVSCPAEICLLLETWWPKGAVVIAPRQAQFFVGVARRPLHMLVLYFTQQGSEQMPRGAARRVFLEATGVGGVAPPRGEKRALPPTRRSGKLHGGSSSYGSKTSANVSGRRGLLGTIPKRAPLLPYVELPKKEHSEYGRLTHRPMLLPSNASGDGPQATRLAAQPRPLAPNHA